MQSPSAKAYGDEPTAVFAQLFAAKKLKKIN
jgi:hypothetical protein